MSEAVKGTYTNKDCAKGAFFDLGWPPMNMNPLNDIEILETAPQHIKDESNIILTLRGSTDKRSVYLPPTQTDLRSIRRRLFLASDCRDFRGSQLVHGKFKRNYGPPY